MPIVKGSDGGEEFDAFCDEGGVAGNRSSH